MGTTNCYCGAEHRADIGGGVQVSRCCRTGSKLTKMETEEPHEATFRNRPRLDKVQLESPADHDGISRHPDSG